MKIANYSFFQILKPFVITVLLFITAVWFFNTIETFLFYKYQDSISFLAITKSFFNLTAVFCLYSFIIFPFYLLIGLWKQKAAQIFAAFLFAIFTLLEIGLFKYYKQTDVLMGAELVARPVAEILTTIRNSSNILINISLIVAVIAFFIVIPLFLKKVKIFNNLLSQIITVITIGILAACTVFYQQSENKALNRYLESKSFYFFSAVKDYFMHKPDDSSFFIFDDKGKTEKIEKNEMLLKEYAEMFPFRTILDLNYPMERSSSEIPDVLSPYFNKSEKQPHIVIVIVESLGSYIMGEKENGVSFTPFLDSLASVGLYWKNCLATTPRTFGVVPAVIASVPHGMKGFQFGIMPKHHSLFSILNNNDYNTNFFYGGDPSFDSMLDFLTVQEPNHIDNFQPQMKTYQKKDLANYWALYDHVLFNESFKFLKKQENKKPNVNVYLTLTTHEPFYGGDKELKKIYEPKTEKIFAKLNPKIKKQLLPVKDIIMPFTYLDDCMRDFFYHYSQQPDFENTIFIITADHSYGYHKNDLANYSVPLIIWSPLLKTDKTFPNIVSHNAITPSVISYLQNNYNLKVPEQIAWCSDGLDTTSFFNPSEKVMFLNYNRKVNTMVYHQFYYEQSDNKLYKIDKNLDLEAVADPVIIEDIKSKFNILKYVNNYVYHNDRLIKSDNKSDNKYKIIKGYENKDTIICKTPDTIPSIQGINVYDILPEQKITGKYHKIKINLTADLVINDYVYQDRQMVLVFKCRGKNFEYISKENITKYIEDDDILCDKKYEMTVEKEIDINDLESFFAHIYVATNESDANWSPDKKITISNIRVLISGKKI